MSSPREHSRDIIECKSCQDWKAVVKKLEDENHELRVASIEKDKVIDTLRKKDYLKKSAVRASSQSQNFTCK